MTDNTLPPLPPPPQQSEMVKTTFFTPSLYGGRFTRMQYFLYMLVGSIIFNIFLLPLLVGLMIPLFFAFGGDSIDGVMQAVLLFPLLLAGIFFFIPVAVKRAHDIGHKGTIVIVLWVASLLPKVCCDNLFLEYVSFYSRSWNNIGYSPTSPWLIVDLLVCGFSFCYGCILLFKDSERGTNAYGTSTKYPNTGLPKLFAGKSLASGENRHCVKKVNGGGRPRLQKSKVEVPASGSVSLNRLKTNDK